MVAGTGLMGMIRDNNGNNWAIEMIPSLEVHSAIAATTAVRRKIQPGFRIDRVLILRTRNVFPLMPAQPPTEF
jgi:hypothetical protein